MKKSPSIIHIPKFRIDEPVFWENHRGGWRSVVKIIQQNLHHPQGVLFLSAVEDAMIKGEAIREPWVGFIHQVPKTNLEFFPDLERLLQNKTWKESLPFCKGLYVLTEYQKTYLRENGVKVPINRVFYPLDNDYLSFKLEKFEADDLPKTVVCMGEYLRNYQSLFDLYCPGYEKVLLRNEEFDRASLKTNDSVKILDPISDEQYDRYLERSIVFQDLYDAPANTSVVECILRGTPLLINPLPGVVEYLGKNYPFYFNTLNEAEEKLKKQDLIKETVQYLLNLPIRKKLTMEYFIDSIEHSSIYRTLQYPTTELNEFETYDLSVIICSYKRVYNIEKLLECFCRQDYEGSFEIILWNNNFAEQENLNRIYSKFKDRLTIKLIHSSENYYCVIRMAVASLVRSDLLLITDDDVVPASGYISRFIAKYKEYGKDSVICCRGHEFLPHELNEEFPHLVWEEGESLTFYDESVADRQIHFLHADNTLIPKHLMEKAIQFGIEDYEFILVDDYFLSFVFSHELKIPIWKIKADDVLTFTKCSDSKQIALFFNQKVQNQRIAFYVHHMRKGWPQSRWLSHPKELKANK